MMGTAYHQNVQTLGFQTSVDLARGQTYTSDNANPVKRKFDTYLENHLGPGRECFNNHAPADIYAPRLPKTGLRASAIIDDTLFEEHARTDQPSEYTQRKLVPLTPAPSQNPLLSLSHPRYALPLRLVSNLESLGVRVIYPWQSSCLLGRGVLAGQKNLVYTAPTGGGKSLVGDILLLKRIIEQPTKKAILVLPYVALVQEKLTWLRAVVDGVEKNDAELQQTSIRLKQSHKSIRVAGFFGGCRARTAWNDVDIAICTIEKANSLVNTALGEGKIDQLGIVVLDELHMLDDENRGYLMELMVTKLMCVKQEIQLVGMSATLSNPQVLANWLNAKYYVSKYRPVPIEEFLVYDNAIYPTESAKDFLRTASQLSATPATQKPPRAARKIKASGHKELSDPLTNAVVALAVETAVKGYGVLVFCSSRQRTQITASLTSDAMPSDLIDLVSLDKRLDVVASLQALPGGFEPTLSKMIPLGIGFHHAGLTIEERNIVATAFDQGVLKVIVATCSLAAGINLPARRVILQGARMGRDLVGPAMLRQMRGRAGRKGKDEIGETYLCCQKADLEAVAELVEAELPPVQSCLRPGKRGVKRALLEVVVTRLANTRSALDDYIGSSLLYQTVDPQVISQMVSDAVQNLLETKLIDDSDHGMLEPTRLGQAVVAASLTPEDGLFINTEMCRALESFVMDGEMHVFYMFTPTQAMEPSEISWRVFQGEMEHLDESGMRALRCIGINPATVNMLVTSGAKLKETTPAEVATARVYRRAYNSFQLRDLCNEIPVHKVSSRYSVPRGQVQNLAQTCHGFAGGMIKFCERMGWGMLAAVLEHMRDRLRAGARADLLEMAQVTYVKSRMARIFWENGFTSVRALAEADSGALVPIMMQAQSRRMRMEGEAAEKLKAKLLEKAEVIVSSANRLWERQQLIELDD